MFTGALVGAIVFVGFFASYIVLLRAYDLQMQKNHGPNHENVLGIEVFDSEEQPSILRNDAGKTSN